MATITGRLLEKDNIYQASEYMRRLSPGGSEKTTNLGKSTGILTGRLRKDDLDLALALIVVHVLYLHPQLFVAVTLHRIAGRHTRSGGGGGGVLMSCMAVVV